MMRRAWTGIGLSFAMAAVPAMAQAEGGASSRSRSSTTTETNVGEPMATEGAYPTGMETSLRNRGDYRFHRNEISVGAGVLSYFAGAAPGTSPTWDVRYGFNASRRLTVEGAYSGAAGAYGGGGPGGTTVATIFEGDVQVKPFGGMIVNPYALAGAGYGNFSTTGSGPGDGTFHVPLGLGAEVRITDRIMADGRFTYRLTTGDNFGPQRADLDNWSAIARVGTQF